ncbi:MAG: hypothetical protein IPO17_01100 [Flavobacteriales bacterium]|nr:hypothetical protein [Flavobacteriales bacterium]
MPRLIVHGFTISLGPCIFRAACACAVLFGGCVDGKKEQDMAAQLVHQLSGQYDFLNCSAYSWHTWTGNGQYVFVGATLPGHQIVGGQDLRSMYADDIAETVLAFYDST